MALNGKVAIVTGAAGGLGRAYVNCLTSLGADIGAIDLSFSDSSYVTSPQSIVVEVRSKGQRCVTFQGSAEPRFTAWRPAARAAFPTLFNS